jgi:hypothetical protein
MLGLDLPSDDHRAAALDGGERHGGGIEVWGEVGEVGEVVEEEKK